MANSAAKKLPVELKLGALLGKNTASKKSCIDPEVPGLKLFVNKSPKSSFDMILAPSKAEDLVSNPRSSICCEEDIVPSGIDAEADEVMNPKSVI